MSVTGYLSIQVMPALCVPWLAMTLSMEWLLLTYPLQPAESATWKCSVSGWAV